MDRITKWVQCRGPEPGARKRLFCLPHAGGGGVSFHSWQKALGPTLHVCSVVPPGRETRLSEPARTDFDELLVEMTEALRPWLDMPFAIFGHSMGALLAFEWVRRLEREQGPQPVHLIVTGRCPASRGAPGCEPVDRRSIPVHVRLERPHRRR